VSNFCNVRRSSIKYSYLDTRYMFRGSSKFDTRSKHFSARVEHLIRVEIFWCQFLPIKTAVRVSKYTELYSNTDRPAQYWLSRPAVTRITSHSAQTFRSRRHSHRISPCRWPKVHYKLVIPNQGSARYASWVRHNYAAHGFLLLVLCSYRAYFVSHYRRATKYTETGLLWKIPCLSNAFRPSWAITKECDT
jgi:hypothetical protein